MATPMNERRWIQARHYENGVGNRLSSDTVIFLLGLMDNRSMVVKGFHMKFGESFWRRGNAYEYDDSILDWSEDLERVMNETISGDPFYIQVHDSWWDADFRPVYRTPRLMDLQQLIYSPMAYSHNQMYEFRIPRFGMHGVYFMTNFLMKIPDSTFEACQSLADTVPRTAYLFGVHLRFHLVIRHVGVCSEARPCRGPINYDVSTPSGVVSLKATPAIRITAMH
jgi:hypothetical protein